MASWEASLRNITRLHHGRLEGETPRHPTPEEMRKGGVKMYELGTFDNNPGTQNLLRGPNSRSCPSAHVSKWNHLCPTHSSAQPLPCLPPGER